MNGDTAKPREFLNIESKNPQSLRDSFSQKGTKKYLSHNFKHEDTNKNNNPNNDIHLTLNRIFSRI